ncbi:acetylglutamate/acetylaminoadipate kinase [Halovenus rubra]|uniref:Acetylglutamate/acetylaminoadipate kinase n=2 Tax=Halovenus rubra TaxID=869890 RepID=A0ACC7E1E2_9EURY|nr:acetylglutamate/acetylaminoadipate kinase [Halovenus rubra]
MTASTIVVKIGGARAVNPTEVLDDVAELVEAGTEVVVTHGGSTTVDDTLEQLGQSPEYVETPKGVVGRFTDEKTMEVFEMVLPGLLNTELVTDLQSAGVDAVGLSGVDGGLLTGPRTSAVRVLDDGKKKIRRGDHSGRLESVDADLLSSLLSDGYTPVVCPPMAGHEQDGQITAVNTDADGVAAAIAGALDATVVFLTDVPGICTDPDDATSVVETVETPTDWEMLSDAAEGFMSRKVMAIENALSDGAPEAIVADGGATKPVTGALTGDGTHVHPEALDKECCLTNTESMEVDTA